MSEQSKQQYAVKNKQTGLLFAGFDADKQPVWVQREQDAHTYADYRDARGQAYLFRCFNVQSQLKPVVL